MDEYNVNRSGETIRKPQVNTELLAKWTNILFWLVIASIIIDWLTSENMNKVLPGVSFAGQILSIAAAVGYAGILLIISSESIYYRNAAVCRFIVAAFSVVLIPVSGEIDSLQAVILAMISLVIDTIGVYYEIEGHGKVLLDIDIVLSDKWHRFWKWYIGTFLGIIAGTVFSVLIPLLGMFLVLASTIGMLVVSVLKIVYIYKMSRAFRAYTAR